MKKGQKSIKNNFYKPSRGNDGGQRRRPRSPFTTLPIFPSLPTRGLVMGMEKTTEARRATAFVLCYGWAEAATRSRQQNEEGSYDPRW